MDLKNETPHLYLTFNLFNTDNTLTSHDMSIKNNEMFEYNLPNNIS